MLQEATVPLPDGDLLVTYLDVTDTARYERVLRERNEALEAAARLKSEFIADVSHEFRTPLNAVSGFAEILTHQYFGDLNPRQLDYSRGILQSSQQLLRLINDVRDLATIEAGYMVLETEPGRSFRDAAVGVAFTRERARSRELEIELSCPPEIGAIVGDERRLKQALLNLISNAIKFTPPGGAIRLAAARERARTAADRRRYRNRHPAIGSVPASLKRSTVETPHSGACLGLALVKNLIELHGGTVTTDSAPGRGTAVTCRLPVAPVELARIESRAAA